VKVSPRRYPLRALLELREREREVVEVELKRRMRALGEALERVRGWEARLDDLGTEAGGKPESGSLARDWQRHGDMVVNAIDSLRLASDERTRLEAEVAECRVRHARARTREEALRRHRQRFLDARATALRKREEGEADEAAARRASQRGRGEGGPDEGGR
jgi:flagellar export protein FliJ